MSRVLCVCELFLCVCLLSGKKQNVFGDRFVTSSVLNVRFSVVHALFSHPCFVLLVSLSNVTWTVTPHDAYVTCSYNAQCSKSEIIDISASVDSEINGTPISQCP